MNQFNGETQECFDRLASAGWTFSGSNATRQCQNGWEGQRGTSIVKAATLEMAVQKAWLLHNKSK